MKYVKLRYRRSRFNIDSLRLIFFNFRRCLRGSMLAECSLDHVLVKFSKTDSNNTNEINPQVLAQI